MGLNQGPSHLAIKLMRYDSAIDPLKISRLIGPKLILRNLKLGNRKKTYSLIEIIRQLSTQVSSTSNSKPIVFLVSGTSISELLEAGKYLTIYFLCCLPKVGSPIVSRFFIFSINLSDDLNSDRSSSHAVRIPMSSPFRRMHIKRIKV